MYDLLVVAGFELMQSGCLNGGTAIRQMITNTLDYIKNLASVPDEDYDILDQLF